jgi:hypothetical protein
VQGYKQFALINPVLVHHVRGNLFSLGTVKEKYVKLGKVYFWTKVEMPPAQSPFFWHVPNRTKMILFVTLMS